MKINYFGKPVDDWKPSYPYLARGKRTGALAVVFSPTKTILIESVSLHGVGYFAGDDKRRPFIRGRFHAIHADQ